MIDRRECLRDHKAPFLRDLLTGTELPRRLLFDPTEQVLASPVDSGYHFVIAFFDSEL